MVTETKHAIASGIHRLMTEILDETKFVIEFSGPLRTLMPEGKSLDKQARGTLDHRDRLMATTMDRFVAEQRKIERRLGEAEYERTFLIRDEIIAHPVGPVLREMLREGLVSRFDGKLVYDAERPARLEAADNVILALERRLRKAKRKTIRVSSAIAHKINAIADRLGNEVQLQQTQRLRELAAEASPLIEEHELVLTWPLDRDDPEFGAWSGTSASDVTLQVARAVAGTIQSDGSMNVRAGLAEKLDTIDWDELRRTLKREMADLARSASTVAEVGTAPAAPPTRNVVLAVLEVLEKAGDEGLPTLQDIADATGYELDTQPHESSDRLRQPRHGSGVHDPRQRASEPRRDDAAGPPDRHRGGPPRREPARHGHERAEPARDRGSGLPREHAADDAVRRPVARPRGHVRARGHHARRERKWDAAAADEHVGANRRAPRRAVRDRPRDRAHRARVHEQPAADVLACEVHR